MIRMGTIRLLLIATTIFSAGAHAAIVAHNLGTTAPPSTMGSYTMQGFSLAPQTAIPNFTGVTTIPGSPIGGNLTLSTSATKRTVPSGGWATWSHGYTGPVYFTTGTTNTLTLPAGVNAFYFYAEPNNGTNTITATTNSGATSGAVSVVSTSGAKGFGFSATAGETITSITIVTTVGAGGFAIGEFAINSQSLQTNPAIDQEVIGLLTAQADMADRFAQTQIANFQGHLENLHVRSRAKAAASEARSGGQQSLAANGRLDASDRFLAVSNETTCQKTAVCQGNDTAACTAAAPVTSCGSTLAGMETVDGGLASFLVSSLQAMQGGSGASGLRLNLNSDSDITSGGGKNVWSAGTVTIGRQSDLDTSFNTSGVSVGTDLQINDNLIVGVGAGFGHEKQTISSNGTKNKGNSVALAVYGSYQPTEAFFLDGVLGYGTLDFDARRFVTSAGTYASSNRDGSQWFASLSGGYELWQDQTLLSPYGRLDLVSTRLERGVESGAGSNNLVFNQQTIPSTKLALGLRGETLIQREGLKIKPFARIEYQREFSNRGKVNMFYVADPATIYQLDLGSADRDTVVVAFGANAAFKDGWQMGLGYRFSKGSSSQSNSFTLQINKSF